MMYRIFYFFSLIFSCLSLPATAQHYHHSTLWLRVNPTFNLSKRWAITTDVMYRRQNDPRENELNFLSRPYLNLALRAGVSYRTPHWTITAFPFIWFDSSPSLGKESDFTRPATRELRPSLYAEWSQNLTKKLSFRFRGGYEYRGYLLDPPVGRLRFRAMLRYNFSPRVYGYFWQEVMTAAPPNAITNPQAIEINRFNLMVGRNLSKHLALEAGYQFTHRQRRTLIEFDEEHALSITAVMRF
jgi:hypothetical protein